MEKSGLEWEQARAVAGEFLRRLESKTEAAVEVDAAIGGREMVEEMRGMFCLCFYFLTLVLVVLSRWSCAPVSCWL